MSNGGHFIVVIFCYTMCMLWGTVLNNPAYVPPTLLHVNILSLNNSNNTFPPPLQFSSSESFHQSACQLQPLANQVEVYYTYQQLSAI